MWVSAMIADSKEPGSQVDLRGDYRLVLKVKNARVVRAIEEAGFSSVNEFCRANNLRPTPVGLLVNLKRRPKNTRGQWTPTAIRIADALQKLPEELWTDFQRRAVLEQTTYSIDIEEAAALGLTREVETPEALAMAGETSAVIRGILDELGGKYKEVLCRRFGFSTPDRQPDTLGEIAADLGITQQRVRQIEKAGLNKIRFTRERRQQLLDVAPEWGNL